MTSVPGGRHALHGDAVDAGGGLGGAHGGEHGVVGGGDLHHGGEVEADAADIALVGDVRGDDLDDGGEAELHGEGDRLHTRAGEASRSDSDAGGLQHGLGIDFVQEQALRDAGAAGHALILRGRVGRSGVRMVRAGDQGVKREPKGEKPQPQL